MQDASSAATRPVMGVAHLDAPSLAGRWSLLQREATPDTVRALALAEGLLDRQGVVTRGAAMAEGVAGGFAAIQQVYRRMEDAGRVLRGRFVEGLGGAQFADRTDVDRLRELAEAADKGSVAAVALSAVDPANPFGTTLPWTAHASGVRPLRRPGGIVVIGGGRLLFYLTQGGRSLLNYVPADVPDAAEVLASAATALVIALRRTPRLRFTLALIDDAPPGKGPVTEALRKAGFRNAPRGLNWEG
ncbi:ATP-dependent helicase [Stenotrophomonas sp. 278]|nr:ATP-dependent helicase [Stenotrophomonas sp. 278]